MYGNDDNEWAEVGKVGRGRQSFRWHRTPWWVFWRKKWYRRTFDGSDRAAGWNVEYATDGQLARHILEETFDQTNTRTQWT